MFRHVQVKVVDQALISLSETNSNQKNGQQVYFDDSTHPYQLSITYLLQFFQYTPNIFRTRSFHP
jgi:hypothetical protein